MWEIFKAKELLKKNKTRLTILIFFIATCILINVCSKYTNSYENMKIRNELLTFYDNVKEEKKETQTSSKITKLEELQKINSEIIALIQIEGTNINYPVLQGKDNEYYMTHNYKREKTSDGALFLDAGYSWEIPSTNLLIYGHNNVGSKEMFADLIKYKSKAFYNKHKIINFTTNIDDAKYEIISVFLSRVYSKTEKNAFRYYFFLNADTKEQFDEFIVNCKKVSLYDTGANVDYGDQLMTLSTCEYSKNNGRFVVVARRINE